eukprot:GHVU01108246.1.p1 GENE.GHVU01108246.1~~GHVU01108246.1.p1  ORF type:complete len:132 (-),score=20.94 GHVU01108246.1:126-521(-)
MHAMQHTGRSVGQPPPPLIINDESSSYHRSSCLPFFPSFITGSCLPVAANLLLLRGGREAASESRLMMIGGGCSLVLLSVRPFVRVMFIGRVVSCSFVVSTRVLSCVSSSLSLSLSLSLACSRSHTHTHVR